MKKLIKYFYYTFTIIFVALTLIEIIIYMNTYSNLLGIIYLFLNFFIIFLLATISFNYEKANPKIRISKNILVIIIGIFSSFIISLLVPHLIPYIDSSFVFEEKILIISKILKPILYIIMIFLSYLDLNKKLINFNVLKKRNTKIDNN